MYCVGWDSLGGGGANWVLGRGVAIAPIPNAPKRRPWIGDVWLTLARKSD